MVEGKKSILVIATLRAIAVEFRDWESRVPTGTCRRRLDSTRSLEPELSALRLIRLTHNLLCSDLRQMRAL